MSDEGYRVLIADDEYLILKGLRVLIDWAALRCEIVGEAQDGRQCLEMIGRLRPDIVITDIRMPNMSGIEMIRAAQKIHRVKFIILSGYSDFEYARQCMALGVQEYLLKPVEETLLTEAVGRVQRQIEQLRQQQTRLNGILEDSERSQMRFRDIFLRDLVNTYFDAQDDVAGLLRSEGIALPGGEAYSCAMIGVPDDDGAPETARERIRRTLEALAPNRFMLFEYARNRYMALLAWRQMPDAQACGAFTHALDKRLQEALGPSVRIGIGSPVPLHQLYLSARQARLALALPRSGDCTTGDPDVAWPYAAQTPQNLTARLIEGLSRRRTADVRQSLERIFTYHVQAGLARPASVRMLGLNLLLSCAGWLDDMSPEHQPVLSQAQTYSDRIAGLDTPGQIADYVSDTVAGLITARERKDAGKTPELVLDAKAYVRDHLLEDTSLVSAAKALYVSPVYLSRVFKRAEGISYIDYVTDAKMEEAARLMRTTDMKIYEVANRLGYKDSKYFSQLFRNRWGYNPSDVRR